MPIQLTPEQEQRLKAVVSAGAYVSVEDAIDAAISVIEDAVPGGEATPEGLEVLLSEGMASAELTEEEFWTSTDASTNAMLSAYKAGHRV